MDYIICAGVGFHFCFFTFYNYGSKLQIFLILVKLRSPLYRHTMPNITHYVSKMFLEKRVDIINVF